MAYRNLSHTEVFISNKAKLSGHGIYKTKVWDKFYTSWLVVRPSILFCQEAYFKNKSQKNCFQPSHGTIEIYPMAEWDKFYGDRINYI